MFSISVLRFQKSDDKMIIMIIIMMMIFIIMIMISMIFNIYISHIRRAAKETALRTSLLLFQSNGVFMWVRVHCCRQRQNDLQVFIKSKWCWVKTILIKVKPMSIKSGFRAILFWLKVRSVGGEPEDTKEIGHRSTTTVEVLFFCFVFIFFFWGGA